MRKRINGDVPYSRNQEDAVLLAIPTKTIGRSDGMSIQSERSDADDIIYQD